MGKSCLRFDGGKASFNVLSFSVQLVACSLWALNLFLSFLVSLGSSSRRCRERKPGSGDSPTKPGQLRIRGLIREDMLPFDDTVTDYVSIRP